MLSITVAALLVCIVWLAMWLFRGYEDTGQLYIEVILTGIAAAVAAVFWATTHKRT